MVNHKNDPRHNEYPNENKMYRFVINRPKESADPETLAEYLIRMDAVAEVDVSDSDNYHGLLIKARFMPGKVPSNVYSYMSSRVSKRYGKIENAITR